MTTPQEQTRAIGTLVRTPATPGNSDAGAGLLRPAEALDLAHLMVGAHAEAFHDGLLLDSCGECARLEAHEDDAAFAFGMATVA